MNQINHVIVGNYFNHQKGWEHTNPGWHSVTLHTKDSDHHIDMVKWLYEHLDKPERHCVWMGSLYESYFKFRYERDYIMFTLRWS